MNRTRPLVDDYKSDPELMTGLDPAHDGMDEEVDMETHERDHESAQKTLSGD